MAALRPPPEDALSWVPFGPSELIAACEDGRVLHTRSDIDCFPESDSLFAWNNVMRLAKTDDHADKHWRLYKSGRPIDLNMMRVLDRSGRLRTDRFESLIEQGASVMINRLELKVPEIGRLSRQIEAWTGAYVRVVAIGSPGRAPCMPLHYDHVDVIAIQMDGDKTWSFYGRPVEGSGIARRVEDRPQVKTDEIALQKGDCLFVPAGLHHQCQPSDGSLHLALNLKWPTVMDFAPDLVKQRPNDFSLLEPIRTYRSPERVDCLLDQLSEFDELRLRQDEIKEFLQGWPGHCAERWRVSNLGEFY